MGRCASKQTQLQQNEGSNLMDQINERIRSLEERLDTLTIYIRTVKLKLNWAYLLTALDPQKDLLTVCLTIYERNSNAY